MSLGLEAVLQYNSGSYGTPSWNAITTISDETLQVERGKADMSTRGTGGWKAYRGTLKDFTLEFDIKVTASDTAFAALQSAFINGTQLDMAATDLPIASSGAQGPRAYMEVESIQRKEPLEDAQVYSIKMYIGYNTTPPTWWTT
jgi:hypothetical protein